VWHDAKHVADHISTQRKYLAYYDGPQREVASRDESTAGTEAADGSSAGSKVHKVSEMGVN
jgi:putative flavoprotein involved in K+ transport